MSNMLDRYLNKTVLDSSHECGIIKKDAPARLAQTGAI